MRSFLAAACKADTRLGFLTGAQLSRSHVRARKCGCGWMGAGGGCACCEGCREQVKTVGAAATEGAGLERAGGLNHAQSRHVQS